MKFRVAVLALGLLLPNLPAISATPPKAGATCTKLGLTQNYSAKKFTCIKSGKKLVWDKGVEIKKAAPLKSVSPTPSPMPTSSPIPTPSPKVSPSPSTSASPTSAPSPTPSSNQNSAQTSQNSDVIKQKTSAVAYLSPNLPSQNIELCKIKQLANDSVRTGFPAPVPAYAGQGVVKWALVPLDFSDLPGEANFMDRVRSQMESASEWADNTSEGKLKITWQVYEKWVRLPGLSTEYSIPPESNGGFVAPDQQRFWQKAIVEADKYVDFTGVQAVHFILPAGQQIVKYGIKGNNWYDVVKNYVTGEGTRIDLFTIPSTFNDEPNSGRNYWSWWMYHFVVGLGVAKYGGSSIALPMTSYFIQASTEGARELGGWTRFLIGWMPESRVYCRLATEVTNLEVTLVPLTDNISQGMKLAVIPISGTRAIILESRRVTNFACTTRTERSGVLAYLYDSKYGHLDEYFVPISPAGRPSESHSCYASQSADLLLHEGDKVTYEGLTIEVLGHGDYDRVKITRGA